MQKEKIKHRKEKKEKKIHTEGGKKEQALNLFF